MFSLVADTSYGRRAKQSQFKLINHGVVPRYSFSNNSVAGSIFPAHFQFPPVPPHLKCQEFPRTLWI